MKSKLTNYIRAGYACLYAVSHEEDRITEEINAMANDLSFAVWHWNCKDGLRSAKSEIKETADPVAALKRFCEVSVKDGELQGTHIANKSVVILKDFHMFLKQAQPVIVRLVKEAITSGRMTNRHLVILGCKLSLPPELEKEVTVIEFELPTRAELLRVAEPIAKGSKLIGAKEKLVLDDHMEKVLDAGSGLTSTEFADAVAYSIVSSKKMDPSIIANIKADTIRKNGVLEIVTQTVTLDDIGGLDLLKQDLYSKRNSFTKEAKQYGLPTPRAVLCCGQPGTGKSLTATAAGSVFGVPLLKLEAGRLFGSLVGESEKNWRTAFATAKAVAPVVFWVDEVDGLFSGGASSGKTDGGTTSRVIKAILQDMQFNSEGVFFVFTCNDIDNLPDPLIDRCDVWAVDLPNPTERAAIWSIQISKRGRKPKAYDLTAFSQKTEGFSGRQIEQAWLKAMTIAFNDGAREPKDEDVLEVLSTMVPTSQTMAEQIESRKKRLQGCAKNASIPMEESSTVHSGRKLV